MLSIAEYESLKRSNQTNKVDETMDFRDFLLNAPKMDFEDDFFENLRDKKDTGCNLDDLFEDKIEDRA